MYIRASLRLLELGFSANYNLCTSGGARLKKIFAFIQHLEGGEVMSYHSISPGVRFMPRNQ